MQYKSKKKKYKANKRTIRRSNTKLRKRTIRRCNLKLIRRSKIQSKRKSIIAKQRRKTKKRNKTRRGIRGTTSIRRSISKIVYARLGGAKAPPSLAPMLLSRCWHKTTDSYNRCQVLCH